MSGIFGTGVSALAVFQRALATTTHNIANANTEGFSRQRVEMTTRTPFTTGAGIIGTGVQSVGITRIFDQFLVDQERGYTSLERQSSTLSTFLGQLDRLMSDPEAGLVPGLESFYRAMQVMADNPAAIPGRQAVLSEAQALAGRFQYMDQRLSGFVDQINRQMSTEVGEINAYAQDIAKLNQDIIAARAASGGQPPNDLLDQRDRVIRELSERIGVNVVPQGDGAVNVFIGNGQGLVVGASVAKLGIVIDPQDPTSREITMQNVGGTMTRFLTGGTLGGALAFRREVLDPARQELGLIAMGVAADLNAQHRLGMDLKGALGGDLFNIPAPRVTLGTNNAPGSGADVQITDLGALKASDYTLRFDGTDWTMRREADGTIFSSTDGAAVWDGDAFIVDGMRIEPQGAAGDSLRVRAVAHVAGGLQLAITDPARVAAAGPLRAEEAVNANGMPINSGDGRVSLGQLVSRSGDTLPSAAISLTYDATAREFSGTVDGVPFTIAYDPPGDEGATLGLDIPGLGRFEFRAHGEPVEGDRFDIHVNNNAGGDNRNALALGERQNAKVLHGASASAQTAYTSVVADTGIRARTAAINGQAHTALLSQATAARESVSGVNLDEEAANLMRFQQAYQAAAQVVGIANTMFDALLQAVRR